MRRKMVAGSCSRAAHTRRPSQRTQLHPPLTKLHASPALAGPTRHVPTTSEGMARMQRSADGGAPGPDASGLLYTQSGMSLPSVHGLP